MVAFVRLFIWPRSADGRDASHVQHSSHMGLPLPQPVTLVLALAAAASASAQNSAGVTAEALARRSCKYRPLPRNLDEGYSTPEGFVRIAETFGVPFAALVSGGHTVSFQASQPLVLGFAVQIPFAAGVQLQVVVKTASTTTECSSTWGAAGHLKQCSMSGLALAVGPVTLTFQTRGLGGVEGSGSGAAACLTLRLDLEMTSQVLADRSRQCPQAELPVAPPQPLPQPSGDSGVSHSTFSASAVGGVVWKTHLPPGPATTLTKLYARITFPSMVYPLRIVMEEMVSPETLETSVQPLCARRCFTGTPIANGQVVQRLLPPGISFMVWILAETSQQPPPSGAICANFDFELAVGPSQAERLGEHFLGPPAWLCEGGAWPVRLEQTGKGEAPLATDPGEGTRATLRSRSFALRDVFDLTRAPTGAPEAAQLSGLHILELKVVDVSIFRLSTHRATVPARPVLLPFRAAQAWQMLANPRQIPASLQAETARIPSAGREFRHSINTVLQPGEYTLVFIMEIALGGLRPCASLLLQLALEPVDGSLPLGASRGACEAPDLGKGMLDMQAMAEPITLASLVDRSRDYSITLPRLPGSAEEGAGDAKGLEIVARSRVNLGSALADPSGPATMLLARVRSPFSVADFQVAFYEAGLLVGQSHLSPDGNGYSAVFGPLVRDAIYEVVLFHVPRRPASPGGPICVSVSVDVTTVVMNPLPVSGREILPLPGTSTCALLGQALPSSLAISYGSAAILEGDFLLPPLGSVHNIQIKAPPGTALFVRASLSSEDAQVRLSEGGSSELQGLVQDQLFLGRIAGSLPLSVSIQVARVFSAASCPQLRLHLVVLQNNDASTCPTGGILGLGGGGQTLEDLGQKLAKALAEQPADAAMLRSVSAVLPYRGETSVSKTPFRVSSPLTELRIELAVEPPWLPLELLLVHEHEDKVWARARTTGQRLAMLLPSLPRGDYQLQLQIWGAGYSLPERCALVFGTAALLQPGGRDTSNYRQEMLDLQELMAVTSFPPKLTPGWSHAADTLLWSQIFAVPAQGDVVTTIVLDQPGLVRLVAEPADILSPRLDGELTQGGLQSMAVTSLVGPGMVTRLSAGTYTLRLRTPNAAVCANCPHDKIPFFVTIGVAAEANTGSACEAATGLGDVGAGVGVTESADSTWLWKRQLTLKNLPQSLKLPITVSHPSVVMIAAWSPFTMHYVRVAFVTEEGLWVGEQRARLSSLEIELPPGSYKMSVEEPAPLFPEPAGCMTVGLAVSMSPFTSLPSAARMQGQASAEQLAASPGLIGPGLGLGARCDGLGALPLPLDTISATGGSGSYGGPIDDAGRLLIRERFLLTDIHDGRKKIFFRIPAGSLLRIAVTSGDAQGVEVVLEDATHTPVAADYNHALGSNGGQVAGYMLKTGGSMWLSFHREHREAAAAGCAAFDFLLQLAPLNDLLYMGDCPGGSTTSLQDLATRVVQSLQASRGLIASADGRVRAESGASTAALDLRLEEATFVEVEIRFNFLLSNVHIRLDDPIQVGGEAAGPDVGASGLASSPLNAQATLQLRLQAGQHRLRLVHEQAFSEKGAGVIGPVMGSAKCSPLQLTVRQTPLRSNKAVVGPDIARPVSFGADVVLQVLMPSGQALQTPLLGGGLAPTASSGPLAGASGSLAFTWSAASLSQAASEGRGQVVQASGAGRLWALPLSFEGGEADGEIWFFLDDKGPGRPWAGGQSDLFSGPRRPWPRGFEAAGSAPSATSGSFMGNLPELSLTSKSQEATAPGGSFFSFWTLCWLALLLMMMLYLHGYRPEVVFRMQSLLERPGLRGSGTSLNEMISMVELGNGSWSFNGLRARREEDCATARKHGQLYGAVDG